MDHERLRRQGGLQTYEGPDIVIELSIGAVSSIEVVDIRVLKAKLKELEVKRAQCVKALDEDILAIKRTM